MYLAVLLDSLWGWCNIGFFRADGVWIIVCGWVGLGWLVFLGLGWVGWFSLVAGGCVVLMWRRWFVVVLGWCFCCVLVVLGSRGVLIWFS